MASQGPNSCGTGANDAAVGTRAWSNPTNIYTVNSSYASATSLSVGTFTTNYLKATNFGFSIPGGATIDGIVVEIYRSCNGSTEILVPGRTKDVTVSLVKGGTVSGDNKADTVTLWPSPPGSGSYATYGDSTSLWGLSWTDSDINASDFGVVISGSIKRNSKSTVTAYVDHIRITIHYTSGGGGGSSQTALLVAGN